MTATAASALSDRWQGQRPPAAAEAWLDRAREVADILAADAVERDRANLPPRAEVDLLKRSGLVTLLGRIEHGGGGQTWKTA